jgi:hypothetical protein
MIEAVSGHAWFISGSAGSFEHGALFTEDLLADWNGDWGITGASLKRPDQRNRLTSQDCLYTAVESGPNYRQARIVGCLLNVLVGPENPAALLDRLSERETAIVPAEAPGDLSLVEQLTGLHDAAPVMHEPFRQWVLEDRFVNGIRPPWEHAGVQFVSDVASFEAILIYIAAIGTYAAGRMFCDTLAVGPRQPGGLRSLAAVVRIAKGTVRRLNSPQLIQRPRMSLSGSAAPRDRRPWQKMCRRFGVSADRRVDVVGRRRCRFCRASSNRSALVHSGLQGCGPSQLSLGPRARTSNSKPHYPGTLFAYSVVCWMSLATRPVQPV